jgi:Tol biopolymer transport system component
MPFKDIIRIGLFAGAILAAPRLAAADRGRSDSPVAGTDEAIVLSEFGGRPAFSPDGKRIAFVGRSYGDAFEIDLATRRVRNLTAHIPHNGVMRIQYLPDGNYLVTAPRIHDGPNTRAHLEMWVLDRNLQKGLQPLGEQVFEGIAVSRRRNLVAWTAIEPALKPHENWMLGFARATKRYMAEIAYRDGKAVLVNKREIMAVLPKACSFIEPQDFRDADSELVYSCMGSNAGGRVSISVMGTKLPNGADVTYYRHPGEYDEVEGIAPGGDWAAVECGKQDAAALPPLDICRLELEPQGAISTLVIGSAPGSTRGVSNPVVSPDGRWIAFQRSDSSDPDVGAGTGLYLMRLPDSR